MPFYQSRELRFVFIFPFMIGILSLLQDSENFDLVLIHQLCTDQWLWGLGSKNKPKNYKPIFFFAVFPVLSNLCLQFLSFISALQTTLQKTQLFKQKCVEFKNWYFFVVQYLSVSSVWFGKKCGIHRPLSDYDNQSSNHTRGKSLWLNILKHHTLLVLGICTLWKIPDGKIFCVDLSVKLKLRESAKGRSSKPSHYNNYYLFLEFKKDEQKQLFLINNVYTF